MDKDQLIDELTADLRPTRRLREGTVIALWFALSWSLVIALTLATGDLRPGVLSELRHSPRFVVECLLGLAVGVFSFRTGLLLAIPGRLRWRAAIPAALAAVALWAGTYAYGLFDPALEPSMVGKRPHCFTETLVFSIFPILLGFVLIARRTPLRPVWAGALVGISASSVPALTMMVACMYDPKHILLLHLVPIGIVGLIGGVLGWLVLRKR